MNKENEQLNEKQLLPILGFCQALNELIRDYKRRFEFTIEHNSDEWTTTYHFTIDLALGEYTADLTYWYDEVAADEKNDWNDLVQQINHIKNVINA